jgi:hypothetical protein
VGEGAAEGARGGGWLRSANFRSGFGEANDKPPRTEKILYLQIAENNLVV